MAAISRKTHPELLNDLTILYTVIQCSVIGCTIVLLSSIFSWILLIFLFGILYSQLADTGIRYESVDLTTMVGVSFFEHSWSFGFFLVAIGVTLANEKIKSIETDRLGSWWQTEIEKFAPVVSLRWYLSIGVFIALVAHWLMSNWGLLALWHAPDVALTLLKMILIYSMVVLGITFVNTRLDDLANESERSGSLRSLESRSHSNFYEISKIYSGIQSSQKLLKTERDVVLNLVSRTSHDLPIAIGTFEKCLNLLEDTGLRSTDARVAAMIVDLNYAKDELIHLRADVLAERIRIIDLSPICETVEKVVNSLNGQKNPNKVLLEIIGTAIDDIKISGLTRHLTNLIKNGIDSSENRRAAVLAKLIFRVEKILLEVRDFGCGISESQVTAFQNGTILSTKRDGNGIGMIQAKEWAIEYGFLMNVKRMNSSTTTGTLVTIEIPL